MALLKQLFSLGVVISSAALAGCTTAGNRTAANLPPASSTSSFALAFQADPEFGKGLDSFERTELSAAEHKALEYGADGQKVAWAGKNPKVSGEVVSFRPFRVGRSNCRRFQHSLTMDETVRSVDGTACRKENNGWRLVQ